jgi:hypothetical protein
MLKIGIKRAGHHLGNVLADAALFLSQTATMNDGTLCGLGFGNAANSAHSETPSGKNRGGKMLHP